ncbi:MAG: cbb3-type cytochrome c oxidase subunit I [Oligoflexia bacterium]|nr:cbb3-type cytochrome c oxidase subunit I [Oligoflexia bacterium]
MSSQCTAGTCNSCHDDDHNYLKYPKGFWSWVTTVDHKRIGLLYLFTILIFFFVAGVFALLVRTELMHAGRDIMDAETYNMFFTLHGAIMIFLFIVPGIPATMGNFLLPLMIGAKDVAFPRLNLMSYYIYVLGAIMALVALIRPIGPEGLQKFLAGLGLIGPVDTGWTFYAPYSLQSGSSVIWMTGAAFVLGFSSILTGLNFVVTVHKLRAPGMSWDRLPVFVWATYATAIIQTLATPVVGITLLLLIMERAMGVGIFNPQLGGDPVLFEHFFWFYSHPVVYIMVLPAFGVVGEIIPVFSRKPIFGYRAVCYASLAIAFIGFLVWAHHMFVAGISDTSAIYFSAATFFVAVPTAVKVFNWVSTMYKGSIRFESPMLYAMGFVFLFMVAGTTGIYLATLAVDVFYHDTYFVVAHFHYTIQGGAVIGLMAALHFWFPKMSDKMYNETLARFAWVLDFVGFNLTFLPQFVLGMEGMPRRYYDYLPQFEPLHQISTVGSYVNAIGYTAALMNLLFAALFSKRKAPSNPYNSLSLEWQTQSPPLHENFKETPVVTDWTYGYGEPVEGGSH